MGRSMPSFRKQLLEIEKLKWTSFKMLPTKKDKQGFDKILIMLDCIPISIIA